MLDRKYNKVRVDKKLTMGKNAQIVATSATGAETVVDMTELAALGGVTATAAELNIMDGVTATAAELNMAADNSANSVIITATKAVAAAESGTTFFINNATGFATTLPAPALGLRYTFINMTANTSGNHTIVTTSSANIIAGGLNDMGGAAGSVLGDGDTISFVANASLAGDRVDLISNGTTWFLSGATSVATGVTVTKAS